ncbi:MAG: hybrid sensor histidine kinase/response regulator, partial [Cyanobacteria bacterium REEB67]|nr:hybrid sensor histidine kinase/response regulator [Cyanobacteria bacterium REEB67]
MPNPIMGSSIPVCSILVVEDNIDDFELLEHHLLFGSEERARLVRSDCLAGALECLQYGSFDIILLDLSLPDS